MVSNWFRLGWQGLACALIFAFISSAIYGQYINYSPAPFMDYWNGVLRFYLESMQDPLAWWVQHNEHRIFLSKLLFWLDMRYFGGRSLLLVPVNTVLLLLTAGLLVAYARKLIPSEEGGSRLVLAGLMTMFCMAWMQNQNIVWGFQSQFILVYLLPLLSFYALARSRYDINRSGFWRFLSVFMGVISAYSMANGLLVLPVLVVLYWLMGEPVKRIFTVFMMFVVATLVFFIGYQSTAGSSLGPGVLFDRPWKILEFTLAYLGNPAYWIFGSVSAAIAAGMLAVAMALFFFWRRKSLVAEPYALALLAFIAYVFGSACVTALGRAFFDISLAASSRYTTPSLLMWAALIILLLSRLQGRVNAIPWVMLVVALLLIPLQMKAFTIDTSMFTPHQKAVAALSIRMRVDEEQAKRQLHPFYTPEEETYLFKARDAKVSIFSVDQEYPVDQLGKPLAQAGGESCTGAIEKSRPTETPFQATAVYGALDVSVLSETGYVLFGDADGLVKGIAIAGRDHPGYGGDVGERNFDGYLIGDSNFHGMRCVRK